LRASTKKFYEKYIPSSGRTRRKVVKKLQKIYEWPSTPSTLGYYIRGELLGWWIIGKGRGEQIDTSSYTRISFKMYFVKLLYYEVFNTTYWLIKGTEELVITKTRKMGEIRWF